MTWRDYDATGQVITHVDRYGTTAALTTTYTYDALGRVTDITRGVSDQLVPTTTHTVYRPDNQVATIIQNYLPNAAATTTQNITTTYGYDILGRRIWTQTVDGRYHGVTAYTAAGQVAWTIENPVDGAGVPTVPSGTTPPAFSAARPDANVVTLYGYDGFGRTILVTQTGILTGSFDLNTETFTATTTRTTHMAYDLLGRPVTTTLNYQPGMPRNLRDVNVETYTYYDGAGNVTWTSDALGRWTHIEYDTLNRPVTTTLNYEDGDPLSVDPDNVDWTDGTDTDIVSVTQYNALGQVERTIANYGDGVTDAAQLGTSEWQITELITDQMTLYQYDGFGRPITTTAHYLPLLYEYDTVGNGNYTTRTAYDAVNGRSLVHHHDRFAERLR